MDDPYRALREATIRAILDSEAATEAQLRAALVRGDTSAVPERLHTLIERIRRTPWEVSDEDWALLEGYSEDQRFEIAVAAAVGAASERFEAAFRALEDA